MGGFAPDRGLRVLRRFSCPNKKWLIELRPFRLERIRLLGTWHCMDQNTGFEAQPASSTRHIGLRRLFGICHKPMPWKMEVLRLRMELDVQKRRLEAAYSEGFGVGDVLHDLGPQPGRSSG